MSIDIISPVEAGPGWAPIWFLAQMATDLFGGDLLSLPKHDGSKLLRAMNLRPRQRRQKGSVLVALLHNPRDVHALRASEAFRQGYDRVAVWIVDSFLHEQMPGSLGFQGIDLVCYMRPNDEGPFRSAVGDRALLLGWGADVLNSGSGGAERPYDLLRLGRQPDAWDDDDATAVACAKVGLRFHGRPTFYDSEPLKNQTEVMTKLRQSRYVLAHSNLAAPAPYTHPTQEYMTARWVDALACGNVVAGVPPKGDKSMARLLWPEAILEFDRIDLKHNLEALCAARAGWTPALAWHNYSQALLRLDWRWRLKAIADALSLSVPRLNADLDRIESLARTPQSQA